MTIKKILGENIKSYRIKHDLTQMQLADQLDISANHLSNIEQGIKFPSPTLIDNMIKTLNVSPSDLFYCVEYGGAESTSLGKIDKLIDEVVIDLKKKIHEID